MEWNDNPKQLSIRFKDTSFGQPKRILVLKDLEKDEVMVSDAFPGRTHIKHWHEADYHVAER